MDFKALFTKNTAIGLFALTSITSFGKWNIGLIQNNTRLQSELEFTKKYDSLLMKNHERSLLENINFIASCGGSDTARIVR